MIRRILKALAIAVPLALAGCKTTEVVEHTPNPGSHMEVWITHSLLPTRTVILFDTVFKSPDWKNWFVTSAVYHFRYGGMVACEGVKRRYSSARSDGTYYAWRDAHHMAAMGNEDGERYPVFYNADTGRFHVEEWDKRDGRWEIGADGWVQEGWPRLMADACPELTEEILADGGWINEKQTHPTIWKMLEQDPEAPFRSTTSPPWNRIGIAAASGNARFWCFESHSKPVLPAHCFPEGEDASGDDDAALLLPESPDEAAAYLDRLALADTLKAANGNIIEDRLGRTYVLALGRQDEFWAIDGEDRLTDVGYLSWNEATETLELDWELKGDVANYRHRPGDPLPVVDTGRQHPLFAIADWLVADAGDVVLPYMGRQARFRFGEDGDLTVRGVDRDFPGTWTVSRGRLVLEIDGIAERAGYPWDLLAGHLRATTGYTG